MANQYTVPRTKNHTAKRFDSLLEWERFALADCSERFARSSVTHTPEEEWDYGSGMDGARDLIRKGWRKGAKDVLNVSGVAHIQQDNGINVAMYSAPCGFFGDTQAALAGDPDCMIAADFQEQPQQPVITIAADFTAPYKVTAQEFTKRGAAILSVIYLLEASGVRVDLFALWSPRHDNKTTAQAVKVKHADQDINLEALAAVFAHPAAFRRIGFGAAERIAYGDFEGSGYGCPSALEKRTKGFLFPDENVGIIQLNGYRDAVETQTRKAFSQLADQGLFDRDQMDAILEPLNEKAAA